MSKVTKKVRRTYEEVQGFKCDYCQEFMMCDTLTLSFGYGCDKDLSPDEHYCSYECLGKAYEKYVPDISKGWPISGVKPPPPPTGEDMRLTFREGVDSSPRRVK